MAANLNSTMKNLGAMCEKHVDGVGSADLSNLKRMLEGSGQGALEVRLAQLKAELSGVSEKPLETTRAAKKTVQQCNGKSQDRLNRIMTR